MAADNRKISVLQAYFLLTLAISVTNHVVVIPLILSAAGRDAWLSVLAASIPALLLGAVVLRFIRSCGPQSLFMWIREHYGVIAAWAVHILFLILLFPMNLITLKDMTIWVNSSFLPYTPQVFVYGTFILLCSWAAYSGLWVITVCAGILLPFVIVLGHFIMIMNIPHKNYALLTPILEHGWPPVARGAMYALSGFLEILLFLLIGHRVKGKPGKSSFYIYIFISIVLMLGPLTGAIANFGPDEAIRIRYPAFEQWRLASLGKHISHLDFFSMYQWMSGSFIRISLFMYLTADLLRIVKPTGMSAAIAVQAAVMMAFAAAPISDMTMVSVLQNFYYPGMLGIQLLLAAILVVMFIPSRSRKARGAGS